MKAVLIVLTNPASPARESEYNDWYTNQHLPDVLAVPGYVAASRYEAFPSLVSLPQRYLTIYDLEVDDLAHVERISREHMRRIAAGEMRRSPADVMERETMRAMYYIEQSPRQVRKNLPSVPPDGVFLAYAAPIAADRDADLNRWYDEQHLPDVLDLPGFTAAQRYRKADIDMLGKPWVTDNPYLTIYEHLHRNEDDYVAAFGLIRERIAAGTVKMTDAIAPKSLMTVYRRVVSQQA